MELADHFNIGIILWGFACTKIVNRYEKESMKQVERRAICSHCLAMVEFASGDARPTHPFFPFVSAERAFPFPSERADLRFACHQSELNQNAEKTARRGSFVEARPTIRDETWA